MSENKDDSSIYNIALRKKFKNKKELEYHVEEQFCGVNIIFIVCIALIILCLSLQLYEDYTMYRIKFINHDDIIKSIDYRYKDYDETKLFIKVKHGDTITYINKENVILIQRIQK